ncbi:MAG: gliding motility-associated ABC transporter substrate-binding protein GldG [Bacteroidetes bacterium HGW-Bacteroidetes-13]|nr:MAG: gliding motility-associated ABC transporter substrate-binding protein GldG [Bacteroidetes bacterium HGW-Bacteroidetes-13]
MNFAVYKKEISELFTSLSTYLVIGVFLLTAGLFFWIIEGTFNLLDSGFADLTLFFELAPWLMVFLTAAMSMKSFSEEKKTGTLQLLLSKPIGLLNLVFNKFLSVWTVVVFTFLPTIVYYYSIRELALNPADLDLSASLTSYFGLVLLASSLSAIGVFCSLLSNNQLLSFVFAVLLSFFFYFGFEQLIQLFSFGSYDFFVENLGIKYHIDSLGKGVLDTRSLVYFGCFVALFLWICFALLSIRISYQPKKIYLNTAKILIGIILIVLVSNRFYHRFDFTKDHRFTLSNETVNMLKNTDKPIYIDVFLDGDLPAPYRKLKMETKQILEEFRAINPLITYNFINPLEDEDVSEEVVNRLIGFGLQPIQVSEQKKGKLSQSIVFPWAVASIDEQRVVNISLLTEKPFTEEDAQVSGSVEQLEYHFNTKLSQLFVKKYPSVAVLKGNGELDDLYLLNGLGALRDFYNLAPFTLDSVAKNPYKTLEDIKKYDLLFVAKPTEAFSEAEKLVLDQYLINGGKMLWSIDGVQAELDSLYNPTGQMLSLPEDLNLADFFFKYGIRINHNLIKDKYSAPIVLTSGEGEAIRYNAVPWVYSPLIIPHQNHAVTNQIEAVKLEFSSSIDTLPNPIKKTILLQSSMLAKLVGTPAVIDLSSTIANSENDDYGPGNFPVAVLLEGAFTSVYKNRVLPFPLNPFETAGKKTKMLVISDGDIFKSQLEKGKPLPLGFDKWTGNRYGNKDLLINSVNYLLDDLTALKLRSKKFQMSYLDVEKVENNGSNFQIINLLIPAISPLILFVFARFYRRRKILK